MHTLEQQLRQMVARGVKFILVSPLRDDLPDWVPAEWWPIRPNTDAALMLGLAGEIVAAGWHDKDFMARCCSGSDELLGYLGGAQDGVAKNAAWAQQVSSIDAEWTRKLAQRLVETRSMLTVSWSLQRADHGEQPFWAALALVRRSRSPARLSCRRASTPTRISSRWPASPTCCCTPAKPSATKDRPGITRTLTWSTGPAATPSTTTRT